MHPIRKCPICFGVDDHPRHVHALPDGTELAIHMDCCAAARDCKPCHAQLEGVGGVEGNPKGQTLREHLWTTGPRPDQPGWTDPSYLTED